MLFRSGDGIVEPTVYRRRCNYFNGIDNLFDESHVAYTHQYYFRHILEIPTISYERIREGAMLYSARCMTARNMNDMAARKLQNALKEKQGFDDERKELLYTLGIVLEKMGKAEDSIKQFMDIYEVDMKFRDVEERVNRHYPGQG